MTPTWCSTWRRPLPIFGMLSITVNHNHVEVVWRVTPDRRKFHWKELLNFERCNHGRRHNALQNSRFSGYILKIITPWALLVYGSETVISNESVGQIYFNVTKYNKADYIVLNLPYSTDLVSVVIILVTESHHMSNTNRKGPILSHSVLTIRKTGIPS